MILINQKNRKHEKIICVVHTEILDNFSDCKQDILCVMLKITFLWIHSRADKFLIGTFPDETGTNQLLPCKLFHINNLDHMI